MPANNIEILKQQVSAVHLLCLNLADFVCELAGQHFALVERVRSMHPDDKELIRIVSQIEQLSACLGALQGRVSEIRTLSKKTGLI
jgi:hypothetical protein